jgi:microcin C transport system substrate-binding protein
MQASYINIASGRAMKNVLYIILCYFFCGGVASGETAPTPVYGLSIFGDLKYPENFVHFDYVNPHAPKGGEVKLSALGTFDSLNPYIVKGDKAPGIEMIFESLMVGSLDEPQSYYGLVAKSATVAPDRSYVEFAMRPEARFHDGSKITADDVIFSLNTFKTEGEPAYRILFQPIASAVKIDDYHVRFNFSDKTRRELPIIAASMPILSKKYYSTHDFNKTTLEPPFGSGPYEVKSVDPGRSIVYERVKNYWGKDLRVNIGQYNFDTIRFDMYRDETVALEAFKAGEYDLREENISRVWATGYDSPALSEGKFKKVLIPNEIPQGMQGFVFNIRRGKFADRRVREAIGLTLDFEWMNKSLFFGAYTRDDSFFLNTPYAAKGLPGDKEKALLEPFKDELPLGIFIKPFALPVTDGSGDNREQLIKADKLLTEAGWIIKDGIRVNEKTGEPLTVEFLFQSPVYERVAAPMCRHLKRLGIDAKIRVIDDAQYVKRIETFDYDIIMTVFNRLVFFPGSEQLAYWHSSQSSQEGSNNLVGTKSKVIDALLEKIVAARNEEELQPPARALDRVLLWENYVIPNWYLGAYRLAYWDKFGRPNVKMKYSHGFPQTWWIK